MAKQNTKLVAASQFKDSPVRSILKSISWRIIASLTTFLIVFVIFRRYTDQSLGEVFENASYITSIEVVAKLVFYYLHERAWTNIRWGKYWTRSYWKTRAWKKLYNRMHHEGYTKLNANRKENE
ncbi:MAG: DUF2061 domain-containing protein [Bacteroidales bacterium]|nr:DUF2061 domain-containing protein [Bacteroidales bacterium]MCF8350951.1 DUF2061 domain-containing protein [Bacteroidales bacterium]MCF8376550.1 DUF2061 domain-containing protein [Bacteroidales bacterium]MCF8400598.1 DUF2061 domain-containing protein [Bacteroidales bacterium]